RPLPSATAMTLVALPRRVRPTRAPPLWRLHGFRRYMPRSGQHRRVAEDPRRGRVAVDQGRQPEPSAETVGDTFEAVDIVVAGPPTAHRFAESRAHRRGSHAEKRTDDHRCDPSPIAPLAARSPRSPATARQ